MRIVSLSPSLTDILIALESQDSLVGASDACQFNQNSIQRIGSPKAVQIPKINALAPGLILADAEDNRPDEIQKLQGKWKTEFFKVRKASEVLDAVAGLGRLVQKEKEAQRLSGALREELSANEKAFSGREKRRTILLVWDQPYLTVNFDAYPSRLIEASGGVNAFREEPVREFPVEMEDMIDKNPEVLLLSSEPAPFRKKHIAQFRQYRIFSRIPIHLVPARLFNRYGPQTVDALKSLRQIYQSLP